MKIHLVVACALSVGAFGCNSHSSGGVDLGGPTIDPGQADAGVANPLSLSSKITTQTTPPPPISGGTLTVLADGNTAVASDPDRDHIYVVDLAARSKIADITLNAGDEPGRVIEDGAGRVHVALRSGGALVTLDRATWTVSTRRDVCPAPRGLAWDPTNDVVHVACAGGELVTFPSASGAATRALMLDRDLRDVVVLDGKLFVSRFRSAQVLQIDDTGTPSAPIQPAPFDSAFSSGSFSPAAAWRMIAIPEAHTLYMLHQRGSDGEIITQQPGGYGGGGSGISSPCAGAIVHSTITPMMPGTPTAPQLPIADATLAVDFAFSPTSDLFAVVSAGNAQNLFATTVSYASRTTATTDTTVQQNIDDGTCDGTAALTSTPGMLEPIAVAFDSKNELVVQSREPAVLLFPSTNERITLSDVSKADTGHSVFHSNAGAGIACASCHLEGGEDGRIWNFDVSGTRRTQSIRGGILGTEPFHWDGDEKDFGHIMTDIFQTRMSGPKLDSDQQTAMKNWVNTIPLLPQSTPPDAAAVARGKTLFEDSSNLGCTGCHSGTKMTNNATVDVGTDGLFQVPALRGVGSRSPYLHDGRAATLEDRFTSIGGGDQHGHTSQLTQAQISDLVAFLNSI